MMSLTHWKKAFNKDYLGSWDLEEGQTVNTIVKKVIVKEVTDPQGAKSNCNVAILDGLKPMILNVTACKQMQRFAKSKHIENWNNIPITIYVDTVKAFGEMVEALRIKDKQPIKAKMVEGDANWTRAIKWLLKNPDGIKNITDKYDVDVKLLQDAVAEHSAK
jgi:hypothetical protein